MSKNIFYADLDRINGKGVFLTGHGKGLVNKNSIVNGEYIANDMVRLIVKDGELFGYQGYIEKEENELTKIDYLLYFYAQSEVNQPAEPAIIDIDTYLQLSRHNIETGGELSLLMGFPLDTSSQKSINAYDEFEETLKQLSNATFIAVPFTLDENQRALFVNSVIK